jgi:hypothetical protein
MIERIRPFVRGIVHPDERSFLDYRQTYFALRTALVVVGGVLPVFLISCAAATGNIDRLQSLSASYWIVQFPLMRNWFVGSLCALGATLVIYRGYRPLENRLLDAAGILLTLVALCPMPDPNVAGGGLSLHHIFAFAFFVMIALTIWRCAGQTLPESPKWIDPHKMDEYRRERRWYLRAYRVLAAIMFASPLLALVVAHLSAPGYWTLIVECIGIWTFAFYWHLKTWELTGVSKLEAVDHVSSVSLEGGLVTAVSRAPADSP